MLEGSTEKPSGLEENRARARTEAKRLKSSLFKRSEFEDFSGAEGLASDFLRSLIFFVHFWIRAKNGHSIMESVFECPKQTSAFDGNGGSSHNPYKMA